MRAIPFGRPMIGDAEKAAVASVLESPQLVHGPRSKEFEAAFADFTGAPHAVSVANCTAGLHLAWMALGVGPGDEVIVPAETHVATAHVVELVGATPVFVDARPSDGNVDLAALEAAITPRTRGIAIVHYLGEPVDMDAVLAIARPRGIPVVEDCALALGTYLNGIHAGLHGDVGVYSFYPVKHMTTGEGGMIITRDADLAARFGRTRAFGVDRTVEERTQAGVYDVTMLGLNYRMGELSAGLGLVQLARVPAFLAARRANSEALDAALDGIDELRLLPASDDSTRRSSWYCRSAILAPAIAGQRDALAEALKQRGVGTSVYYPAPVPLLSHYRSRSGHTRDDFPVASSLSYESIALPVGPHVDEDDMAYIGKALREVLSEVRA